MEVFWFLGRTSVNIDTLSFNCLVKFTKIMLHNPYRLVNEAEFFDLFLKDVEKGNMNRDFLAVLDKHYWSKSWGEKVLYGFSIWNTVYNNNNQGGNKRCSDKNRVASFERFQI